MTKKKKLLSTTPTDAILESISDGVFTVDHDWIITSFNRAAEQITGIKRGCDYKIMLYIMQFFCIFFICDYNMM